MTKEEAIKELEELRNEWSRHIYSEGVRKQVSLDMAIKALEQEPRWISVKDRLPQKGEYGDVLVTFVPPAGTLWATVMIARYSDLMGIAKPCFHIGEVGKESFENITPQVTAWMPFYPKPYREVKE